MNAKTEQGPTRTSGVGDLIDQAVRDGVRLAVLRHKKLGEAIVEVREGKVVVVQPEDILPDDPACSR